MRVPILVLLITLLFSGCKKKITQFYIDYTSSVVIQSSVGELVPFSVYTPDVTTNSEFEFESNDTRKDKINSIKLSDLSLTITSPSNETFSFLNSIHVFISSPSQPEKKVAFKESIPPTIGNKLICDIVDLELQEYIKDQSFKIRIETVTDETIPQDVYIDLYSNFFVDAKILRFK